MRPVPVDIVVVFVVTALLIVAVWSSLFEREDSAMRYQLTDQGRVVLDTSRDQR